MDTEGEVEAAMAAPAARVVSTATATPQQSKNPCQESSNAAKTH
jgi:hypothetical protein